eukprot:scaffold34822_cov32-Tisochrysis_lutea.AAC.10
MDPSQVLASEGAGGPDMGLPRPPRALPRPLRAKGSWGPLYPYVLWLHGFIDSSTTWHLVDTEYQIPD